MRKGVDILISTPGRLITLIKDRKVISAISKQMEAKGKSLEGMTEEERELEIDKFFAEVSLLMD